MAKWFKLTKNQYIGFFALGLAFFALQELPYIIMPLIPLTSNPLMEMQDKSALLNAIEKVCGISSIIIMLFLVRDDAKWFSLGTKREKSYFIAAIIAILGYFIGWVFYFIGFQSFPIILCTLVALPPIYYSLIGMWRRNHALAVCGGLFLVVHIANVWNNMK